MFSRESTCIYKTTPSPSENVEEKMMTNDLSNISFSLKTKEYIDL